VVEGVAVLAVAAGEYAAIRRRAVARMTSSGDTRGTL
jgi:hypothetical protein